MRATLLYMITIVFLLSCAPKDESPIKLNEGQKWAVNTEMKVHIMEAEELLVEFLAGDEEEHGFLAEKLADQNNKLIASCNMTDQAHNELHKWLHPHMKLISELEDAETPTEANAIIVELQKSFETYNQYFE